MNTAAYIHGAKDVRIATHQPAKAGVGKTLVDVASVGICGSDLHYYKDGGIGTAQIQQPFVPGHEFSAHLTTDLESLGLTRGQLVAVDPALSCNQCEWCHQGFTNLCPNVIFLGAPPYHGALTQSIAVPITSIVPLPETITADQGAMLEPLGVCIHAIDLAKPRLLESVAVLGCGPIGLGILQLLVHSGCGDITAIDPQAHRAQLAAKLGAQFNGTELQSVLDNSKGLGCDLVIEASNSPDGFADAIKACKIGGRIVLVGIPDGDFYSPLCASDARRRGLNIKFSRRMGHVYPRAIELVVNRKVDVDILISHRFELDATANAFELQANEAPGLIKSLVYPRGFSAQTTLQS